ncbi:beta-agarase C [Aquimarina agarivorans]|uniref:beta-agarase C n=1 Tax=Aquimarina agarivorans TaxID=980584 RepID=UPI000248F5B2|nr:beta-agarase C [Aquimarina agarivorans]
MKIYKLIALSLLSLTFACSSDDESPAEEMPNKAPVSENPTPEPIVIDFNPKPASGTPLKAFKLSDLDPSLPSFVSLDNTTPDNTKWEKVEEMSDEFDEWDPVKWRNSFWNYGGTPVSMRAENSFVEDGKLNIKATLDPDPNTDMWFRTARVHSQTQIKYPMYTECSMKTAKIAAFNTFWMNNGDIDNRDEIDIVENNANPTADCRDQTNKPADFPWTPWLFPTQMNSQYFIAKGGRANTENRHGNYDTRFLSDANPNKGKTWDEDYHIVGAWWIDERNVQFYLNGEPAGKVTTQQDMTLELELIFDLWTAEQCNIGGLPEREALNDDAINTMRVDWVRTWKLKEDK